TGATAPVDTTTLVPLAGSAVIDQAQASPSAASAYPVNYQLSTSYVGTARTANGAAADLGAIEK
ncbi:MAG: hypothetical protein JSR75_19510, partial [Proteobacteria bacterium]|nr:hypothetical protein [Pseudomonadota bacterium]